MTVCGVCNTGSGPEAVSLYVLNHLLPTMPLLYVELDAFCDFLSFCCLSLICSQLLCDAEKWDYNASQASKQNSFLLVMRAERRVLLRLAQRANAELSTPFNHGLFGEPHSDPGWPWTLLFLTQSPEQLGSQVCATRLRKHLSFSKAKWGCANEFLSMLIFVRPI